MSTDIRASKRYVFAVTPEMPSVGEGAPRSELRPRVLTAIGQMLNERLFSTDFRNRVWTREHAYLNGEPDQFCSLISVEDIERILRCSSPESNRVQLAFDGKYIDGNELTDQPSAVSMRPRLFDVRKLQLMLRRGATLIINGIDEIHEPIGVLTGDIEAITKIPSQVNLYASWGTSAGFGVHWDEHEVIVLQISGHKEWRLFGATDENPIRSVDSKAPSPTFDPLCVLRLGAGDVLYIPRGYWHSVHPIEELTIHLTFGLHAVNGLDLMRWLRSRLESSSFLRGNVASFRPKASELANYSERFKDILGNAVGVDQVESFISDQSRTSRRRSYINLKQINYLVSRTMEGAAEICLAHPMDEVTFFESEGVVIVNHNAKRFLVSKDVIPVLNLVRESQRCRLSAVLEEMSPGVNPEEVRDMIFQLCEAGLITLR